MKFSRKFSDNNKVRICSCKFKDKCITVCPGASLTIDIESLRNSFLSAQIVNNANVTILNSSVVLNSSVIVYTYNVNIYEDMSIIDSIVVLYGEHVNIPVNVKNDAITITNNTVRKLEDIHIKPDDGDTILVVPGTVSFKDDESYESKHVSEYTKKYDFGAVKNYSKHTQKLISREDDNNYCRIIDTFDNIVDHKEDGVIFSIFNDSYIRTCDCDDKYFVIYGAKYAYVQQGLGFNFVIFIGNNDLVLERIDDVIVGKT